MKIFLWGLGVAFPIFAFAAVQQATIITRPGVATAPLKYYFDLSSALAEGINQSVKVTISASNAEKTAVRFDSVQLFDQSGATLGRNVASKTDALTATPYAFVFQNFGVPASELKNVAGVQITFMDLGGENPTGKVTVQGVAVSVTRDNGEACVIEDPIAIVLPPPPPPTIVSIQTQRPLVRPGTRGTGNQSCGAQQDTYSTAGTFTWTAPTGVTSVQVEVWGGGGTGTSAYGDKGAGGGAYSKKNAHTVTPRGEYSVIVGAGGAAGGGGGGDSYFVNMTTVLAKGGQGGGDAFGLGGVAADGVGDVKYSGGNGGAGTGMGGGGGSSAGTGGNGNNGSGGTGGSAPAGGGAGGNGAGPGEENGYPGTAPGGGGGSSSISAMGEGGLGAAGRVLLTYTASGCGASVYDSFMDLLQAIFRFKKIN